MPSSLLNLRVTNGEVRVARAQLGRTQTHLTVLAIDGDAAAVVRRCGLSSVDEGQMDVEHKDGLETDASYSDIRLLNGTCVCVHV